MKTPHCLLLLLATAPLASAQDPSSPAVSADSTLPAATDPAVPAGVAPASGTTAALPASVEAAPPPADPAVPVEESVPPGINRLRPPDPEGSGTESESAPVAPSPAKLPPTPPIPQNPPTPPTPPVLPPLPASGTTPGVPAVPAPPPVPVTPPVPNVPYVKAPPAIHVTPENITLYGPGAGAEGSPPPPDVVQYHAGPVPGGPHLHMLMTEAGESGQMRVIEAAPPMMATKRTFATVEAAPHNGEQVIRDIKLRVFQRHFESALSEATEADKALLTAPGAERESIAARAKALHEFAGKLEADIRSLSTTATTTVSSSGGGSGSGSGGDGNFNRDRKRTGPARIVGGGGGFDSSDFSDGPAVGGRVSVPAPASGGFSRGPSIRGGGEMRYQKGPPTPTPAPAPVREASPPLKALPEPGPALDPKPAPAPDPKPAPAPAPAPAPTPESAPAPKPSPSDPTATPRTKYLNYDGSPLRTTGTAGTTGTPESR